MFHSFFHPKSIAIIGASRESKKVGYQILKNTLEYQKANPKTQLFPVNPKANSIVGLRVHAHLTDISESVELAIIVVPPAFVESVIDECIAKQVKAVVIITAGFAEMSEQGKILQEKIAKKLHDAQIALLGPNSLGFLAPHSTLNASFADQKIAAGSLGLISQSGAMLTALFTEMESNHIGCSFAVSLGNKAGLSENEALEFAAQDPHTKVVGIYLESFTDLPRFFQVISKLAKTKPIILLKGGRSKVGQAASLSHTAALATNDVLLKAASAQFGFVMVDTMQEFMQSIFFLEQHPYRLENAMIITNAGGPGVNTVDVSEVRQLTLAAWSSNSVAHLQELLPNSHISNPLDVIGDADAERFSVAIAQAQRDPQIDSIVVIITQQSVTNVPEIVHMLLEIKGKKPLSIALVGGDTFDHYRKILRQAGVHTTAYPNENIEVLSIIQKSSQAKYKRHHFTPFTQQHSADEQTPLYATKLNETFSLLGQYGFQLPSYSIITNESQLKQVHTPSYAKTANLALTHKKEVGAVYGVVKTQDDVSQSYQQLKQFGDEVLYQQIIEAELELLLGINRDLQFGPYMAVGLGGSWTNVLSDRSYSFLPTTRQQFMDQLKRTKAYGALDKLSNKFTQNFVSDLVELMLQLQLLMHDHPELQELEINPLMVNEKGFWVADVKVKTR